MSVLYSHVVTENVKKRFLDAEKHRDKLHYHERLVVTDSGMPEYLGDGYVLNIGKDPGPFCIARYRNAAIDYALKYDYDLLVIGDADSVFLPETLNRKTIFSTALVAHLNEVDTPSSIKDQDVQFRPCSWFILHSSIFSKHRFDEAYKGYGYEDLEYNRRLNRNGIHQGPHSLLAYHLWHPINVNPNEMSQNHARYLAS